MHTDKTRGFTLIELSIVLVIIGLLVGGVMAGRELIHAAKLSRIGSEQEQFKTASFTFLNKYNCRPGDCPNAHTFFGATCGDTSTDPDVGCNGDGTGVVDNYDAGEHLKFWMHLSMAQMIEGSYTGRGDLTADGPVAVIGVANPPSKSFGGLGWDAVDYEAAFLMAEPNYPGRHAFHYGGNSAGSMVLAGPPFLSRIDAFYIDNKYDDGFPSTGMIRGDMRGDCRAGDTDPGDNTYFALASSPNSQDCQQSFFY